MTLERVEHLGLKMTYVTQERKFALLKGKVKQVIAVDVDEAVIDNKSSDKQIVIEGGVLDIDSQLVDLIVADYVLEHVEDTGAFYRQINEHLKSGGWFCARTPHKYGYVAIAASLIKNVLHSKVLKLIQPKSKRN